MALERPPQYRRHAQRSRELAESAQTEEERALFLEMAHHWEALADIFDRLNAPRRTR